MLTGDPIDTLKNAVVAADYASARGLVTDVTILDRLAALQSKAVSDLTALDQQELNKITNALMKSIGPAESDRVWAAQPHSPKARFVLQQLGYLKSSVSIPGSIFAICLALIIIIIPLTTLYNRLTISIAELREVEQLDFFYIVYQARAAALQAKNASTQDMQASLKKLRELESRINVNNLVIASTVELSTGTPRWYPVLLAAYGFGSSLSVGVSGPTEVATVVTPTAPLPMAAQCATGDEVCLNRLFTIAYGLSINPADVSGAYFNRRQAESAVALLGGSMLPVLYGFLGASVYLLRRYLGEAAFVSDPNFGMRAYLRLGLGGIAGLAIGWFWTPSSAKAAMEVASLGTAPFASAFLAGFSIELLFSILDRVLAAVNPNSDRGGGITKEPDKKAATA